MTLRVIGPATIDRATLQQSLGNNVRASRTAIWLPRIDDVQDGWKATLLDVLAGLAASHFRNRRDISLGFGSLGLRDTLTRPILRQTVISSR